MKRHSLLFALFIFLSSLSMQAEETAGKWSERYNVTAITMDEGLPHNFVDDILKDSQGFLWIATRGEGIARYDGYEFTAFNMGSTHTKLRSNFINKLCEDNFKRIWAVISELINLSLSALLDNGDEVLVPSPDYPLWTANSTVARSC